MGGFLSICESSASIHIYVSTCVWELVMIYSDKRNNKYNFLCDVFSLDECLFWTLPDIYIYMYEGLVVQF